MKDIMEHLEIVFKDVFYPPKAEEKKSDEDLPAESDEERGLKN